MADLYDLLGVERNATPDDIKRAYRKRARELHPDAPDGDEELFKELNRAREVLSDPQRRARYDRFGDDGTPQSRGAGGDPFGFGGGGGGGLGDVLDAFFGQAFGGGGAQRTQRVRERPGRDVLVPVTLTLEEVARGVRHPVEVEVAGTCQTCGGSGSRTAGQAVSCQQCNGSGQVQRIVRTAFGQLATAAECPACEATGRVVADPCIDCHGQGRHNDRKTITVDIKPGVEEGDRLRVSGAGEAGRHGAASGDLFVEIHVAPHEVYERSGRDLVCELTIPFSQAALGATLTVPSITGDEHEVTIKPGTQFGDVVTLRRVGLPARGGGSPGDLHVRLKVAVPRDLDDEQEQLLRDYAKLRGEDVPEHGSGLFTRFKRAFR